MHELIAALKNVTGVYLGPPKHTYVNEYDEWVLRWEYGVFGTITYYLTPGKLVIETYHGTRQITYLILDMDWSRFKSLKPAKKEIPCLY